jgi:Protein of unknown function (DUF4058)
MPSPCPGMNLYLEHADVWQDFHQSFIPLLRQLLSEQVRPKYLVKIEEQIFIHELPDDQRQLIGRGDMTVSRADVDSIGIAVVLLEAPAIGRVPLSVDVERHAFLEIRDRANRQLVTVLELLSPSNKRPGPDREQYLAKRQQWLTSSIHLVELDLLRGGPRLPIENSPPCDYCVMVSRYEDRPNVGLWPLGLRDKLPTIPIPLLAQERVVLDLQSALHQVYDAAGYEDYIYTHEPIPPLQGVDVEWAQRLIAGDGVSTR